MMKPELIPLDRVLNKYLVTFNLVNQTGLRIGASEKSVDPTEPDNAVFKVNDVPCIPGTSLKGVFRSAFKSLFNDGCEWCEKEPNKQEKENFERLLEAVRKGEKTDLQICDTCLLFGNGFIRGRLYFSDSFAKNARVAVRDGVMIDRHFESAVPKRKYDYEVIEPGAVFEVSIVAVNVEKQMLEERLKQIVGLINLGVIRFGGGKSRGLGVCRVEDFRISDV